MHENVKRRQAILEESEKTRYTFIYKKREKEIEKCRKQGG